jgi:site-specific DNA recombinase
MLLAALRSESLDGDLAAGRSPDTDASGLRERKVELQTQIDEYRGLVGTPGWGPKEIGAAVAKLTEQISAIDLQLTPTLVPSLVSQIASPGLTDEEWGKLTVETKRALLNEMVTVTLLPTPKGNRIHQDPADYVSLEWAS